MIPTKQDHTFILNPSWKFFFWEYCFSILTAPIGIGFIGLYFTRRKHKNMRYRISNIGIISTNQKYEHRVDLVNIDRVEIQERPFDDFLGIATLLLQTSALTMELKGLTNAREIKSILEKAVAAEKKRQQQLQKTKPRQKLHQPGNLDKMEYLTGLWQQGLISEEDYNAERKHFE